MAIFFFFNLIKKDTILSLLRPLPTNDDPSHSPQGKDISLISPRGISLGPRAAAAASATRVFRCKVRCDRRRGHPGGLLFHFPHFFSMLHLRQHALRPILELALLLLVKFTLGQHRRRWTAAAAVVVDEITVCLRPLDNFLFARIIVVVRRFVVDEFHGENVTRWMWRYL